MHAHDPTRSKRASEIEHRSWIFRFHYSPPSRYTPLNTNPIDSKIAGIPRPFDPLVVNGSNGASQQHLGKKNRIPAFPRNLYTDHQRLQELAILGLPEDSRDYSFLLGFNNEGQEYDYLSAIGNLSSKKELGTIVDMNDRDLEKITNHEDNAEAYRFYISRDIRSFSEKGLRYIFGGHYFSPDFLHSLAFHERIGINTQVLSGNKDWGQSSTIYGLYFTLPLRETVSPRWGEEVQLGRFSQIDHRSSLELFGTDGERTTLADIYGLAFCLRYDCRTLKTTVFIKMRIGISKMIQSLRNTFRTYNDMQMSNISDSKLDEAGTEEGGLGGKKKDENQMVEEEIYEKQLEGADEREINELDGRGNSEDTNAEETGKERNEDEDDNESEASDPYCYIFPHSTSRQDPFFIVIIVLKAWINTFKKSTYQTVYNNTTWLDEKTQEFIRNKGDKIMYDDLNCKIHVTQRSIAQIETELAEAISIFEQLEYKHNEFRGLTEFAPLVGPYLVVRQICQVVQEAKTLRMLFWQEATKIETCSKWLSEAMSHRNTEAIKAATVEMSKILEQTGKLTAENRKEAKLMSQIAINTQKDGQSMKIIAILTMIFLPGSFVSSVFGWNIISFDVSEDGSQSLVISKQGLQIFLISFFTFTIVTISGCWIWVWNSQKSLTLANADIQRSGEDEKAVEEDSP
ncbi:hypothetical protein TWF751_003503 [Orbilia oligospora]|nr:hypothetical protein TWF751_003503 [Orbilia oligospora]